MLSIDHLSDDQLSLFARDGSVDANLQHHVKECLTCKRRLGAALLVGQLISEPRTASVGGGHLTTKELNLLHAVLFEGNKYVARFLSQYRHLSRCELCFTQLFNLHLELSPPTRAIDDAVATFLAANPRRVVGRVSILQGLHEARLRISRAVADFVPPTFQDVVTRSLFTPDHDVPEPLGMALYDLDEAPRFALDYESHSFSRAKATLPFGGRAGPGNLRSLLHEIQTIAQEIGRLEQRHWRLEERLAKIQEMAGAAQLLQQRLGELEKHLASLHVELSATNVEELLLPDAGVHVSVQVVFHGGSAQMRIIVRSLESDAPLSGATLTLVDRQGEAIGSATTEEAGQAELGLHGDAMRLQVHVPPSQIVWELELAADEDKGM
jgi:hypothetical protein